MEKPLTDRQRQLVESHIAFARYVVRQLTTRVRIYLRADMQDLESAAYLALCVAARNFDESLGFSFRTYAYHTIRRFCQETALHAGAVTAPTLIFSHNKQGVCEKTRQAALTAMAVPVRHGNPDADLPCPITQLEARPDQEDPFDQHALVERLLVKLDRRRASVLHMRFVLGLSLAQTGAILGVGKERVRQLQSQAIERVRKEIQDNHPEVLREYDF